MIKTRLVKLLAHAKKYIFYNVLWQWLALLGQIAAVVSIAALLEEVIEKNVDVKTISATGIVLIAAILLRFLCDYMSVRASHKASADVCRGSGAAGNLFWEISASVILQSSGTCNIVCDSGIFQSESQRCSADLRAIDSCLHCGSSEACKKAVK